MRQSFLRFFVVLTVFALVGSVVHAAERKISRGQLPAAVQKTADEQTQAATVRGYSKDTENGQVEYEVEAISNGHHKDITIAPDGSLLEIEEEVSLGSLPAAVQSGLGAKAGNGKISKVESITKHGAIVAYEGHVITAGKRSEIQVGPAGQPLDHEE